MTKQTTALRRRRFERIVVLVDITVVLLQHEPKKLFAAHVFNSVSRILKQCNEHSKFSTLWGYKFFDPFHYPVASRSKIGEYLGGAQMSEQFDAFAPNLEKFGKVLDLIVNNHRQYTSGGSRGDYVARTISEVICGYTWDPLLASDSSSSDEELQASKERLAGDGAKRDSNAIILFSSVPSTWTGANCFFNLPQLVGDVPPDPSAQSLLAKTFRTVREALKSRNIQVCFVDVPMHQGLWSDERLETVLKPTAARNIILKSLSDLVRTVIALDLLVGSPALLPCKLVWNTVADLGIEKTSKKSHARILCQGTMLLCEVQLQPFNVVHTPSTSRGTSVRQTKLLPATDKLDVVLESVQPKSSLNMKLTSERFLMRQSVRPKASLLGQDTDSFGDKVLQLLDQSAFRPGNPGWQLLLLTLASKKLVCEVSLRIHEDSHSLRAVLEPFTSQCAILTVFERESIPTKTDRAPTIKTESKEESVPVQGVNTMKRRKDAAHYAKHEGVMVIPSRKRRKVAASHEAVINWQEYWEREITTSASTKFTADYGTFLSRYIEGGKASQSLQILDSFFKERPQPNRVIDLVDPLAAMDGAELSTDRACTPAAHPDINDAVVHPGIVSGQNAEAIELDIVQLQAVGQILAVGHAKVQEDSNAIVDIDTPAQEADPSTSMACQMTSEEAKEYIASVGQKVEDYLTSADVNSRRFAGMLVAESYRSLSVLTRQTEDDQQRCDSGEPAELDLNRKIAVKLKKLLLKSHKGLLAKYKNCVGSPSGPIGGVNVDDKVKEYELQILLRLEMISLDEGPLLEQTAKDLLVKDICKLLDNIQFHLDGGIFGGKHFLDYCDRLLVRRYTKKIPSTISKIYSVMELDGYSVLPPPSFAQESNQETSIKTPTYTEDLLLREAGVSQDSMSCSERFSNSATGGLPSGSWDAEYISCRNTSREDSKGRVQSCIYKGTKKQAPYNFSSTYRPVMRIVKHGVRHISAHSKPSKGRSRPNVPVTDDAIQVVCQTPAPMAAPNSHRAHREGDVAQLATLALPKDFTECSPKHERVRTEQPPSVVEEGTPVVRRRLTLHNFANVTGSGSSLDEMVVDIDRTSDAVSNLSAACPSKMNVSSFGPEPCQKSVPSGVSSGRKQGVLGGDLSFSALLESVITVPPRTAVGNLESHRGSNICHNNDDEDDDDDEDGIISTPFRVNRGGHLQSQADRPGCHKRPCNKNIASSSVIGF